MPNMAAENLQTVRMKCGHMRPIIGLASQQLLHALLHFQGRFVREGYGQNSRGNGAVSD